MRLPSVAAASPKTRNNPPTSLIENNTERGYATGISSLCIIKMIDQDKSRLIPTNRGKPRLFGHNSQKFTAGGIKDKVSHSHCIEAQKSILRCPQPQMERHGKLLGRKSGLALYN